MRKLKLLIILIIGIIVKSCISVKFDKKPPFRVMKSTYNVDVSNSKSIYIEYSAQKNIQYDSIFFQKQRAKLEAKNLDGITYVFAVFPSITKPDLVLDNNPVKELNNPIPKLEKFPFELKFDEAIISYKLKNKLHFYKVTNVVKGENHQNRKII